MFDGNYDVTADTPVGKKSGTVTVSTSGDAVTFAVDIRLIGKQQITGKLDGNRFSASGKLKSFILGNPDYTIEGEFSDDSFTALIKSEKGDLSIAGQKK